MTDPTPPSSSSNSPLILLRGMELTIPSLRDSGEPTTSNEWEKPLPPLPLRPRKPSRYSPLDSATMCSSSRQRLDIHGHCSESGRPNSDQSLLSATTRGVSVESPGRISSRRFGVVDTTLSASTFATTTVRDDDSISIDRLPFCLEWRNALRRSLSSGSSYESLQSLMMDCDTEPDTQVTIAESLEVSSSHATGMALGESHHEYVLLQNRICSPHGIDSPVTGTNKCATQDCARSSQSSYVGNTRREFSSPAPGQSSPEDSYSPSLYDEQHPPSGRCCTNVNDRFHHHSASSPSRSTRSSYNDHEPSEMQPSRSDEGWYKITSSDSLFASWLATHTDIHKTHLESAAYDLSPQEYDIDPNNNSSNPQHRSSSAMSGGRNSDRPQSPTRLLQEIRRNNAKHLTEQDRWKRKAFHETSNEPNNPLRFDFTSIQDALSPARSSARTSARSSGVDSTATADSLGGTSYTGSDSSRTVKRAQAVQIASGAVERDVRVTRSGDAVAPPPSTAAPETSNSAASRYPLKLQTDLPRNNSIASATASPSSAWSNFMNSALSRRPSSSRPRPRTSTPKEVPPEMPARPLTQESDKSAGPEVPLKTRLSEVVRGKLRSNKAGSKAERKREELRRSGNTDSDEEAGPSCF